MYKAFSKSWNSSKQPRKQRKYRYNAPHNIRGRFMHANLAKELRQKYNKRSIRVRKGDKVKILRGQFKGKEGRVDNVNVKNLKVFIEKIEVFKKDGSKAFYPTDPSNVMIIELADDKRRLKGEKK